MAPSHRKALAALLDHYSVPVVEDCCSYDLTASGLPAPMLAGEMSDDLVLTIGTLSKLFWGGLRIGWLRASSTRIRQLIERRKAEDLASPISTQVVATNLMTHVGEARRERRALFKPAGGQHVRLLATCFRRGCGPHHKVVLVCGPILTMTPQLWLKLQRVGVRLAPGPGYSAYDGQRTMLRLPVWHEPESLEKALGMLRRAISDR